MVLSAAVIKTYRKNILLFVSEQFKVNPDRWQEKALIAFSNKDNKRFRLSLQACAGPGKSAVLAWCGLWFLCTQGDKGNHPKGAVISVTETNLKDNLWAEFSKWMQLSKLCSGILTWTKSRIFANEHPETWFLSARSFNKSANAEEQGRTLSGIHGKFVLFLIDESGDIPVTVLKSAEQALSTDDIEFARIVQAGNPTSVNGMLYAAQSSLADSWSVIRITGDPKDQDRSPRINVTWAQDQIDRYGEDDPWVMSYILGRFPASGINTIISVDDVDMATKRNLREEDYEFAQKRLGVDVARFGHDATIIFPRQGLRAFNYIEMRNARSNDIAARVMLAKSRWYSEMEFVDGTGGFGSGVIDSLLQAGTAPQEIHFSGKAIDSRYYNKRAEMWFNMAEWIKRGGMLPDCAILRKELTAPTYSFKNGKFILEDKQQIKERLGFSPDRADGLALTFAMDEMPSSVSPLGLANKKKLDFDFDPINR